MQILSTQQQKISPDGSATTLFETTPPMSTYLVAFHVSDFGLVTSFPPKPIPQRVFSRPTALGSTDVALEAGELLLDALSDYVDIEFSLPKVDHIAVPGYNLTRTHRATINVLFISFRF